MNAKLSKSSMCCGLIVHGNFCGQCGAAVRLKTKTSNAEMYLESWARQVRGYERTARTFENQIESISVEHKNGDVRRYFTDGSSETYGQWKENLRARAHSAVASANNMRNLIESFIVLVPHMQKTIDDVLNHDLK